MRFLVYSDCNHAMKLFFITNDHESEFFFLFLNDWFGKCVVADLYRRVDITKKTRNEIKTTIENL